MTADQHAIVVGAGLAGSLMAAFLARAGYHVDVYEGRPDPRDAGFVGGRSINLALSKRGLTALAAIDLADDILRGAVRMRGRMMHDPHGQLSFQYYSRREEDGIYSVSRAGLNIALIHAADSHSGVTFHFEKRCADVDFDAPAVHFESGESARGDFIIGADGAFSAVRSAMLKQIPNVNYEQTFLQHGYKELSIPAVVDGEFAIEPNALHIWPRGGSMMIALPNIDGSFTCTLFWPYEGPHGFSSVTSREQIHPFFERHYPDAVKHMPTLVDDFESNPIGSLVTIRCEPWHVDGRALLIGDAAHAIVPFYGQGINAGFEDCRVLAEMLRDGNDRNQTFQSFSKARQPHADAIAAMALENFIEMRDHTASRVFRLKKQIANRLHAWFPRQFTPLYNFVTFTNVPYAEARDRSRTRVRRAKTVAWILLGVLVGTAVFMLGRTLD